MGLVRRKDQRRQRETLAASRMASAEKFCLKWNDFESNVSVAFRELREEKDFFDVTLACEDSQVSAHKVILSACSPFFRSVLRKNPHQHPLLYMKGVKYQEMLAVLNFMYMGEVNVAQEDLNSFLAVAEDLRVKGLTQGEGAPENKSKDREPAKEYKSSQEVIRLPVKMEPAAEISTPSYNTANRVSKPVTHSDSRSNSLPQPTADVQQSGFSSSTTHNIYGGGAAGNSYPCEQYNGQDYEEQEGEEYESFANGFNGEDDTSYRASETAISAEVIAAREEEIVSNIERDPERKVFTCALCHFSASSRHKAQRRPRMCQQRR